MKYNLPPFKNKPSQTPLRVETIQAGKNNKNWLLLTLYHLKTIEPLEIHICNTEKTKQKNASLSP